MGYDSEKMQNISLIYRNIYKNQGIHRNILRKELTKNGKISKTKYAPLFESLVALGKIKLDKDNVYISPTEMQPALLQKLRHEAYIVTPNSKKHYPVDKRASEGYKNGDVLDVIIEYHDKQPEVIILGKSNKEFVSNKETKTLTPEREHEARKANIEHAFENSNNNTLLGRVMKTSHDKLVFIPNKKSLPIRQIPILNNKEEYSKFQDKICVMELENPETPLVGGKIVAVKGEAGNPVHEYDAIAENYGAIMSWNDPEIQREIQKIPNKINADSLNLASEDEIINIKNKQVADLRNLPFATIDPATCKDMDDAIYSTINENGDYVCYTAVASVSKYVNLDSQIGERYINGGFTIYSPNKAYNILPTELSTGICSLNPDEDRLAFVVKTVIDKDTGEAKSSRIYDAIIRSRQKYSYEQAQEITDNLNSEEMKDEIFAKIARGGGTSLTSDEQILMNYYTAEQIKKGFAQRRMIRFESNKERDIIFDSDMKDVVDIKPVPHLLYHEVIESFMITANEASAKFAKDHDIDVIYRVHDAPNPHKISRADEFFEILGINYNGDLSAQDTNNLISLVKGSATSEIINDFLIKMQSRAVYSDHLYKKEKNVLPQEYMGEQISHYALQSKHYSHTTSPIRRVVDYITHYNILAFMHDEKPITKQEISDIIEIANKRQLDIDQAEKDFDDISSVFYCEKHIGETFSGRISKFRIASPEEGYRDEIIVIAKNQDKGISVEIPLSQIIGAQAYNCNLSEQRCAVYDHRGNVVLTLCKPINFIIEKADRKTMNVTAKTNRALVNEANHKSHYISNDHGFANTKYNRVKRYNQNKKHEHAESHKKEKKMNKQWGDE